MKRDLWLVRARAARQGPQGICCSGGAPVAREDHDRESAVTESVLEFERGSAALVASGLAVAVDECRDTALIPLDVRDPEAVERFANVVVRGVRVPEIVDIE
jgi:hypothetical protein